MSASTKSLVGTTWEAKDGRRTIRVEGEMPFLGNRHLEIINLETRRRSTITESGLLRKFHKASPFT